MVKKYLCVGMLVVSLLLQSVTLIGSAKTVDYQLLNSKESALQGDTATQVLLASSQISQDELKKQQEQLAKDQAQLKKDQEQLKKAQEQLKKDQEELKKAQDQLKKAQETLDIQTKTKKLNSEITSKTYLNYLKKLGYYKKVYKNDEKLNIRNTLLLFQSDHNMSVTGNWDDATKAMLINRLVSPTFTYIDTIKQVPTTGKWIVVNKTNRTLTLYENTNVIKKYAVAVGNPSTLTKTGKFIVTSRLIDPYWGGGGFADPIKGGVPENPLGSRWLGINRTDGSYGIHGTNSLYSIGKYISHGCIRMQNYCIEELFPLVPMNANVWVGTASELKKWGITQNPFEVQK